MTNRRLRQAVINEETVTLEKTGIVVESGPVLSFKERVYK